MRVLVAAGLMFPGVVSCAAPLEQPDLNTYGAVQPLCLIGCRLTFTLSEGDGGAGDITSTISETETRSVEK